MSLFCPHYETTPAVDGMSVCVKCGAAVPDGVLRERDFDEFEHTMIRQSQGHTTRCLRASDGSWACPPDCRSVRAREIGS